MKGYKNQGEKDVAKETGRKGKRYKRGRENMTKENDSI